MGRFLEIIARLHSSFFNVSLCFCIATFHPFIWLVCMPCCSAFWLDLVLPSSVFASMFISTVINFGLIPLASIAPCVSSVAWLASLNSSFEELIVFPACIWVGLLFICWYACAIWACLVNTTGWYGQYIWLNKNFMTNSVVNFDKSCYSINAQTLSLVV